MGPKRGQVKVVATGTFELLHPGHILYLKEAKKLGDELFVIVARDDTITHKRRPLIPEAQRLKMIESLRVVDHAVLGSLQDKYEPLKEIQPDILTLGFDQQFDEDTLRKELKERGFNTEVVRIKASLNSSLSSSKKIKKIIERMGDNDRTR